jgi:hypothetical protein
MWRLRGSQKPLRCPGCKSRYWDRPRKLKKGSPPIIISSRRAALQDSLWNELAGEATTTKLVRDFPKLLNEAFGRERIDVSSIRIKLGTIYSVAPHAVRFLIDHRQEEFGVTRSVVIQNLASLCEDLAKQRVVKLIEVNGVHWTAEGQCQVFNNGDMSLEVSGLEVETAISRSLPLRA